MNATVVKLEPTQVWKNFERLNAVPRPSKKEQRVIEFMRDFGKELGLPTEVDEVGNVLIRKPATPGREKRKTVILQGHLDMVHQKNNDTQFDFSSQGIQSYVDDGWVKAKGTTLGADNGIGVASIMAVLESKNLQHGPLEALFTIDEETGLTGAARLKPGWLRGEILLNTDTEEHGELCIGCAGGVDTIVTHSYSVIKPPGNTAIEIKVKGLKGGHSGCDIHLGRGNANKILNRLLYLATKDFHAAVCRIDGGNLRNAIPRESSAVIVVQSDQAAAIKKALQGLAEAIGNELKRVEPDLLISLGGTALPDGAMEFKAQQALIRAVYAAPNGVFRMSNDVPGLVETSTSMARVSVSDGKAQVEFLSRSSVDSGKDNVKTAIEAAFELAGCQVQHTGGYPGWTPNKDSAILQLMVATYKKLFGEEPKVAAVHAGLECGIIGSHYPQLDMISFGPTIRNPHSPDEMCEIESVQKYWRYLVEVLANTP
jgi:dipeptidase D